MDDGFDDIELDDDIAGQLHELFTAARSSATAEEMSAEMDVVSAMLHAVPRSAIVSDLSAHRAGRHVRSKTGVRAAIVTGALLVGASTAAATGILPDAAQSAVARVTSHVGIDVPDPHDDDALPSPLATVLETVAPPATDAASPNQRPASSVSPASSVLPTSTSAAAATTTEAQTASSPPTPTSAAAPTPRPAGVASQPTATAAPPAVLPSAPDAPSMEGLCKAWRAHGQGNSVADYPAAMERLEAVAAAAGQTVEQFCASWPAETTSADSPLADQTPAATTASPTTPAEPATPATPTTPAEPAEPAAPATPTTPVTPVTPTEPLNPDVPDEVDKPGKGPNPGNKPARDRSSTADT